LQGGQIVEARRDLRGALFLLGDVGARLPLTGGQHGIGGGLVPDPVNAVGVVVVRLLEAGALINALVAALVTSNVAVIRQNGRGLKFRISSSRA